MSDADKAAEKIWNDTFVPHPWRGKGDTWVPQSRAKAAIKIAILSSNTLIEEQAARIAELEKERDVAWESREWHRVSMECQTENLIESQARLSEAVKVLEKIAKWHGEFPETGEFWVNADGSQSDRPVSYGANYGSNGERDYMREQAKAFIATLGENKNDR